jgi:hypothetical protein
MVNIKITRKELKQLIAEGVRPIAEAWKKKNEEVEASGKVREMVKSALEEALKNADSTSDEEEKECISCSNQAMRGSDKCEDCARHEAFYSATRGDRKSIQEASAKKAEKQSGAKSKKKEVRKPDSSTLRKVPLDKGGYTKQGKYFGVGETLWEFEIDGKLYYTRASDKASALEKIAKGTDNQ